MQVENNFFLTCALIGTGGPHLIEGGAHVSLRERHVALQVGARTAQIVDKALQSLEKLGHFFVGVAVQF